MKYTVKQPDGSEVTLYHDALVVRYNGGEIPGDWPAKPEGSSSWTRVADVLGLQPPLVQPESARERTVTSPGLPAAFARRYMDAYRVAKFAIRLGEIIKLLGFVVAGVLALVGVLPLFGVVAQIAQASNIGAGAMLSIMWSAGAFIFGLLVGGFVFVVGVLVSAQGQALLASIDAAVSVAPSLSGDEKLAVMGVQTQ